MCSLTYPWGLTLDAVGFLSAGIAVSQLILCCRLIAACLYGVLTDMSLGSTVGCRIEDSFPQLADPRGYVG